MARILLFAVIAFVVWLLLRGFSRGAGKPEAPPAAGPAGEDMVTCARCGVNMPRSEARQSGGAFTCNDPESCRHAR